MGTAHGETLNLGETGRFVVLTGLSGSGKSQAIHALEDLGYFCVDNLPTSLIPKLAALCEGEAPEVARAAVVVDVRDTKFLEEFPGVLRSLRKRKNLGAVVIFLEASDEALVQRFSETRRPHPLAPDQAVVEGIKNERRALARIKRLADRVFDTSGLTVHELRRSFMDLSTVGAEKKLKVTVLSFGHTSRIFFSMSVFCQIRILFAHCGH